MHRYNVSRSQGIREWEPHVHEPNPLQSGRGSERQALRARRASEPSPGPRRSARSYAVPGALILAACVAAARAEENLTQADLLHRVIDVDRLVRPAPAGERSLLFSSFNRASRTIADGRYEHWDASQDAGHFLGQSGDGWDVMARIEGAGVVSRLWIDRPAGRIRILVDGKPVIESEMLGLFRGEVAPLGPPLCLMSQAQAGAVCYFPLGFSKSCEVQCRGYQGAYELDATRFARGAAVQPFTSELDDAAKQELQRVVRALDKGLDEKDLFRGRRMGTSANQAELRGGEKVRHELAGAGTIRAFYIGFTNRREPTDVYALHRCVLRVFTDGRTQPDIEAPLLDFFSSPLQRSIVNGLPIGTDKWLDGWYLYYCYFPMPYRDGMVVEIENRNSSRTPLGFMIYLRTDRAAPEEDALRFFARFRKEDPCKTFDVPVLETGGRGRLVGLTLAVDCPREAWWGEGDCKAWLDGEEFPSLWGADTSGAFGVSRGFPAFQHALMGAPLAAPYGKNALYRWRLGDSIAFHQGARFALENAQENQADDVYYATLAYWYGQPGQAASFPPLTDQDLAVPGLRIPGAIEIETGLVGGEWGNVVQQKHLGVDLSGDAAASIATDQPLQVRIPAAKAGRYRLMLRISPARSFKIVKVFAADGTEIGAAQWFFGHKGMFELGTVDLAAGENIVRLQCEGNPLLDCWVLTPATP